MASETVKAAFEGLKDLLAQFHEACDGNCEDISSLFSAMSGQRIPAQALYGIMGLSQEFVDECRQSKKPVTATKEQLDRGLLAALDEGDTAEMYVNTLRTQIDNVKARHEGLIFRESLKLDEATALALEEKILNNMKEDRNLKEHIDSIRSLHDAWSKTSDPNDPQLFPVVVVGPQVLAMDRIHLAAHQELLTPEQREAYKLSANEDTAPFVMSKLAPYRAAGGKVAAVQVQRVCWLAEALTGVVLDPAQLADSALVTRVDELLVRRLGDAAWQAQVDAILQDVSRGHSQARIKAVEALLADATLHVCRTAAVAAGQGYAGLVWVAAVAALSAEALAGGAAAGGEAAGGGAAGLQAIKGVRRKIGERFFRKKWLPLESNPDIFNQLGRQLGLPESSAFYEVFGLDPDLLAMVPSPATAVLVCFPLTPAYSASLFRHQTPPGPDTDGPYFLEQTVSNACGTVALVHAFAALPRAGEAAGAGEAGWLGAFVDRTAGFSPMQRAAALEEDEALALSHNHLARQGDTRVEDFGGSSGSGAYTAVLHFVCYVCHAGTLYELDGLKKAPVARGPCSPDTLLLDTARLVAAGLPPDELRVNLMALAPAAS